MATTAEGALVERARAGDQQAFGQLFDRLFDRVHDLSRRIVHDDGIAGEVAQDAFLTAWRKLDSLQDPDAFGGWLLRIARNGSLNRLAKERRSVTLDDEAMTAARDAEAPDHDPLERMDQAARIALVWDAAAALGERDASVLDLHLRHGLTPAELADELGVTPNNAHQVLFTMRKRLGNAVRALVLWRAGHPTCPDLRQGLAAAGLTSFGAPMLKAIDRHVDGCVECSDDRTERLSPAALFAAAPIVVAGTLIRSSAASALASAGVPMGGSAAAGAGGAAGGGTAAGGAGPGGSDPGGSGPGGPGGSGPGPTPGSGPAPGPGPEPAPERRAQLARRQLVLAGAFVALVLAVLVAVIATRPDNDNARLTTATETTVADRLPDEGTTTTLGPDGKPGPSGTTPDGDPVPDGTTPGDDGTPTTTAAPTTTIPPPVVERFDATPTSARCKDGRSLGYEWQLTWDTTGADSATVGRTGEPGSPFEPDDAITLCAPSGTTFVLDAEGPGGTTSATAGGGTPPTTTTTSTSTSTTTTTAPPIVG